MNKAYVGHTSSDADVVLVPGENLYTGVKPVAEIFGEIDSIDEDILTVASGIYATDLCFQREEREQNIRTIDLSIEVVNKHAWERVKNDLRYALMVLSKDNWNISFVQKSGIAVSHFTSDMRDGAVLLFSGGIDSMCAASEFLRRNEGVVLVSHNTQGNAVVDNCQKNVHEALEKHYKKALEHIHIKVFGRNKGDFKFPEERENSQRTRSYLFLSLAAVVMRKKKFSRILFMAENGQFAIHLPLNQARVGPFSTHTADPEFLNRAKEIFSTLIENKHFSIENPFLYLTKAEVFKLLPKPLMKAAIKSGSCWKISRTIKHCGECVPCISRRIAIEHNGIKFDEYVKDVFKSDVSKLSDEDTGKRNLVDYLEFISKFSKLDDATRTELAFEFPELFNSAIDKDKALDLYHRISIQSYEVFEKYPKVKKII